MSSYLFVSGYTTLFLMIIALFPILAR